VVTVNVTEEANEQIADLPLPIQARMQAVIVRLANWPAVSGAKPLRGDLKGNFRIRTGDYRLIFRVSAAGDVLTVWKIGNRGDIYD
jgi:mRNA interferase RelE/StbE